MFRYPDIFCPLLARARRSPVVGDWVGGLVGGVGGRMGGWVPRTTGAQFRPHTPSPEGYGYLSWFSPLMCPCFLLNLSPCGHRGLRRVFRPDQLGPAGDCRVRS